MPIALVSSAMPVLLLLAMSFLEGGDVGSRAVFGLAVMAALIVFVFVQFLREARDLENHDH
jgi:hypothetical protein